MTPAAADDQLAAIRELHEGCAAPGIDYWLFGTDVGLIGDVRARVITLDALRFEKSAGYGGPDTRVKDHADLAALRAALP